MWHAAFAVLCVHLEVHSQAVDCNVRAGIVLQIQKLLKTPILSAVRQLSSSEGFRQDCEGLALSPSLH